jgi:hypothetical protein
MRLRVNGSPLVISTERVQLKGMQLHSDPFQQLAFGDLHAGMEYERHFFVTNTGACDSSLLYLLMQAAISPVTYSHLSVPPAPPSRDAC